MKRQSFGDDRSARTSQRLGAFQLGGNTVWTPILIFLLLGCGILLAGYVLYQQEKETAKADAQEYLTAITRIKGQQIAAWLWERKEDTETVARDPLLAREVGSWLKGGEPSTMRAHEQAILDRLRSIQRAYGYQELLLVDEHGVGTLTTCQACSLAPPKPELLAEAIRTRQTVFSDMQVGPQGQFEDVSFGFLAPIHVEGSSDAKSAAAVYLRISPRDFLFPLIRAWPTSSRSAETMLVRQEMDSVVYLSDLRYRKRSGTALKLPLHANALPVAVTLPPQEGVTVEGADYRGIPVVAVAFKVQDSPWAIVSKIDAAEIYEAVEARARRGSLIVTLLVAAAGMSVTLWWRQRQAAFMARQSEVEMRLEQELLAQRFGYLSRYANDVILLTDERDRIVEMNDRASSVYRYTRDELLQMKSSDLLAPNAVPVHRGVATQPSDDVGDIFETRQRRKDGSVIQVEVSARTFTVEGRRMTQSIIRDITERKRAEESLRIDALVFDNTLEGITVTDADVNIITVNNAFSSITGYTADEVIGSTPRILRSGRHNEEFYRRMWHSIEETGHWEGVIWNRRKNGEVYPEWKAINAVCDASGKTTNYIAVFSDITERLRKEQELSDLNARLEQRVYERTAQLEAANRELEAFSYSVSHDLRAPLRSIDGFSSILLEDNATALDVTGTNCLMRIRDAAQRMGQLIDNMLTLAQVTRREIQYVEVNLSSLAHEIAADLRQSDPTRRVEWAIADGIVVNGTPSLLRDVLQNLLGNAWKYSSRHEQARIEFGVAQEAGRTVYFVKDDGAGFDMAYAAKLFGVFQRLHSAKDFAGTGVGLATVQRIIARHQGRIWADSEVEKGSTFYFTLWERPADRTTPA